MKTVLTYMVLLLFVACQQPYRNATASNDRSKQYTSKKSRHKTISHKQQKQKLTVKKVRGFHLFDLFRNEQKRRELKCPHEGKKRKKDPVYIPESEFEEVEVQGNTNKASIRIYQREIAFDVVHVEEKTLNIPVFKQFKNNMTDFTANGEEEFKQMIALIEEYLGNNTHQSEVTLYIEGGASQIPTSFDPDKPNNGINKDGSSIKGQTSVENNVKLAHARAMALKGKIHEVFPEINIIVTEVTVGKTAWSSEVQKALDEAYLAGDEEAMNKIFAPFQKDQYVKVRSEDMFIKTVEPNNIKMYTMLTRPFLIDSSSGKETVKGHIVISQNTYNRIQENMYFKTVEDRNTYLESLGLLLEKSEQYTQYHLLDNYKAKMALHHDNDYERIYQLYLLGIVNDSDEKVLEEIIVDQHLGQRKYKYVLKKKSLNE